MEPNPKPEPTKGEIETARRLGLTPEFVRDLIFVHMDVLLEQLDNEIR